MGESARKHHQPASGTGLAYAQRRTWGLRRSQRLGQAFVSSSLCVLCGRAHMFGPHPARDADGAGLGRLWRGRTPFVPIKCMHASQPVPTRLKALGAAAAQALSPTTLLATQTVLGLGGLRSTPFAALQPPAHAASPPVRGVHAAANGTGAPAVAAHAVGAGGARSVLKGLHPNPCANGTEGWQAAPGVCEPWCAHARGCRRRMHVLT